IVLSHLYIYAPNQTALHCVRTYNANNCHNQVVEYNTKNGWIYLDTQSRQCACYANRAIYSMKAYTKIIIPCYQHM
ncbi:MAG: hypothetical protein ACKPKO_22545, partial [Candidatus Fonsibacter sp.]